MSKDVHKHLPGGLKNAFTLLYWANLWSPYLLSPLPMLALVSPNECRMKSTGLKIGWYEAGNKKGWVRCMKGERSLLPTQVWYHLTDKLRSQNESSKNQILLERTQRKRGKGQKSSLLIKHTYWCTDSIVQFHVQTPPSQEERKLALALSLSLSLQAAEPKWEKEERDWNELPRSLLSAPEREGHRQAPLWDVPPQGTQGRTKCAFHVLMPYCYYIVTAFKRWQHDSPEGQKEKCLVY
jgi:hypothetical protein